MKKFIEKILPIADLFLSPFVFVSAFILKNVRHAGVQRLPLCRKILFWVGVFPIRKHYYEPIFDTRYLPKPLSKDRNLPGIDWNVKGQLEVLNSFKFNKEFQDIPESQVDEFTFFRNNPSFGSGDAEYWYNIIRVFKPKRIIEIGSGYSTLMAIKAVKKNMEDSEEYACLHFCIEPYEMPWLEKLNIEVIRKKVEDVDASFFLQLEHNDVLFIDSSHVIRPQGDVLFEYLEILPILKKGVIVHIHDVFSPRDYLENWVKNEIRLWNEQYLLEAFLTLNNDWKVIGALNFLRHNYYENLKSRCPFLTPDREPGSFYIQRI